MHPTIRIPFMRLICCILAVSLSLTSLVSASMMGSMSHDGGMVNESGDSSCDQHKKPVMVHAQTHGTSPNHSDITDTEEMTCNICICAVCSTIISSAIINSRSFGRVMDWRFPEPEEFISTSHSNLYKPPRP